MCTTNCYNNFFISSSTFLPLVLIDLLICQLNIIQFSLLLARRATLSKVLDTAQWFLLLLSLSLPLWISLPACLQLVASFGCVRRFTWAMWRAAPWPSRACTPSVDRAIAEFHVPPQPDRPAATSPALADA